ncbi:hypothetical protein GCM10010317_017650 [Streptomyces mirabilis]|nr:hypothetical protein GCM10010317_017650 [Streptomyces mirabilis]
MDPNGHCSLGGTGVKLGDPFETNWGASCPTDIAPAPEAPEKKPDRPESGPTGRGVDRRSRAAMAELSR